MRQRPFVLWLSQQDSFMQAKNRVSKARLNINGNLNLIATQYIESMALERLCALIIFLFTGNDDRLTQTVIHKEDIEKTFTTTKKLRNYLNAGYYFSNSSKQHLTLHLLDDLLRNRTRNVYTAKKNHPSLLRQIFIKQLTSGLCRLYAELSVEQLLNICLDITSVFFMDVMEKGDAEEDAVKIMKDLYMKKMSSLIRQLWKY